MTNVPVIIICLVIGLNLSSPSESQRKNASSLPASLSYLDDNITRHSKLSRHEHNNMPSTKKTSTVRLYHGSTFQHVSIENRKHPEMTTETSFQMALFSTSISVAKDRLAKGHANTNFETLPQSFTIQETGLEGAESEVSTSSFAKASEDKNNYNINIQNPSTQITTTSGVSPFLSTNSSKLKTQEISRQHPTNVLPETNFSASLKKNGTDGLCSPKNITTINATSGVVTWTYDYASCIPEYNWVFIFPQDRTCILEFHRVDMRSKHTLFMTLLVESTLYIAKKFTEANDESLAPLVLFGKEITITVRQLEEGWKSSFNISFTTQLGNTFPIFSVIDDAEPKESYIMYDCTGVTVLPEAITCDGVRHCLQGEDEDGCAYTQEGCGDWFPYNNHCLKAKFVFSPSYNCGDVVETAPLVADETCRSEYNASLALLPDTTGIQIAANLIRKSGFLNAAVGIRKYSSVSTKTKHLYRFMWQWGGPGSSIAYEQQQLQTSGTMEDCGVLIISPIPSIQPVACVQPSQEIHGYICMRPKSDQTAQPQMPQGISFPRASQAPDQFPTKECPDGSVVQTFHRCQWGQHDTDLGMGWSPGNLPLFQCRFGPAIHYTLLCDGNGDCADGSDEIDCQKLQFSPLKDTSFVCKNSKTIAADKRCNGIPDCTDDSDEEYCISCPGLYLCSGIGCVPSGYTPFIPTCKLSPASAHFRHSSSGGVQMDGYGMSVLNPDLDKYAEGVYECLNGLCIPTFLINNGEKDCPHGEDENIPLYNITCPGYYRCKGVGSCVHKNHLCDGIYHCPDKDDETFCHLTCPHDRGCVCEGHAFTCSKMINPFQYIHVRYLDLNHASDVSLENIHVMEYIFFLNLSFCYLGNVTLENMPHLQTLDLSFNSLTELASVHLHKLSGLLHLNLSNNPLGRTLSSNYKILFKSGELANLKTLVMSDTSLGKIPNRMFSTLANLKYLDLRNNPLHSYDQESLWGLDALEVLFTDQSKLCCTYFHSSQIQCYAPVDELSSCDDLLGQDFFRIFLWTFSVLAIFGNTGVLIYRLVTDIHSSCFLASKIFLKNLCVSDFLMGIYLIIIGVADIKFQGSYVAKEAEWTKSMVCTIAGFLSFVSSEVSAFLICIITLDRVLVICFPFKPNFHLTYRITIFICCMIWLAGIALAAVPLVFRLEFYGLSGICLPLPITRQLYSGQSYAFSVFIILNFGIFLIILIGQLSIYRAVRNARIACGNKERQKDMIIARRLFLIVFTDFCCWFPVGVMGLLAFSGIPIPGQLNVWTLTFVLPLNSALNPFLYTLNGLMEQWEKRKMKQNDQRILRRIQEEILKWQPSTVQQLAKACIMSKKIEKDVTMGYFESTDDLRPNTLEVISSNDLNA